MGSVEIFMVYSLVFWLCVVVEFVILIRDFYIILIR